MINSLPILVASENADFRSFLRLQLEKNGFFHIFEAESASQVEEFLGTQNEKSFALLHHSLMEKRIIDAFQRRKEFIVIAPKENESLTVWTAQLGVDHFMSFPFSSERLMAKMKEILH
jgi:DNA-binding response OmpR family regulator